MEPPTTRRDSRATRMPRLETILATLKLSTQNPTEPIHARSRLEAVKTLLNGTYVAFAGLDKTEELAGSVIGTVLPISYHPRLELIADPALLDLAEMYFNAARLDRSVALATDDYVRLAQPRLERITAPS